MSATAIHILFDILAWLSSLTTLIILRRTWFPNQSVAEPLRIGYIIALIFGAGVGAWLFGTANLWISGLDQFGRSIAGALAGAIIAIEIYKKLNGITARTGAIYALPMTLGIAVGRIGCLLSGLKDFTYGIPTGANWGWDFGDRIMRHPVQLYETIAMLGFAALYVIMIKRGSTGWRTNGFYYAVAFYATERFILEFFKPYGSIIAGFTIFQLLSLGLLGYAMMMKQGEKMQ